MTGKELIAEKQAILDRLKKRPAMREAIIAASTAAKLARLDQEERDDFSRLREIEKTEGQLFHATAPTARETELSVLIADSSQRERHLFDDARLIGGMAERFIRENAVEYFRAAHDEAKKRLRELNAAFPSSSIARPGGRTATEMNELEATIEDWSQLEKTAKLGERIWQLREDRKGWTAELESLRAERQQAAVLAS